MRKRLVLKLSTVLYRLADRVIDAGLAVRDLAGQLHRKALPPQPPYRSPLRLAADESIETWARTWLDEHVPYGLVRPRKAGFPLTEEDRAAIGAIAAKDPPTLSSTPRRSRRSKGRSTTCAVTTPPGRSSAGRPWSRAQSTSRPTSTPAGSPTSPNKFRAQRHV